MKKIIVLLIACSLPLFVFASDVGNLLKEAQTAYESGDVSTAIQKLDSAKSIMEKEQFSSESETYAELSSWDIVKLKKSDYLGKKVKIKATFCGVNSDGSLFLTEVSINNSYEETLIDKIISLKKFDKYIFYGTVTDGVLGPKLYVEAIE